MTYYQYLLNFHSYLIKVGKTRHIGKLKDAGSFQLGFLVVLISPGNGNGSLARGAIWASVESLSIWFDRWNQWKLHALQGPG